MVKEVSSRHGISIRKAAKLLGISRSSLYYSLKGEKEENLKLMELIDQKYMEDPTYGVRRMKWYLHRVMGKKISIKRVRRLMRKMGFKALYPVSRITESINTSYVNLLKEKRIIRSNQVWFADITYVRVKGGYGYCMALIDGYSRKVMAMKISNTLDAGFCLEAAKEAVRRYGAPDLVHTDKGKQFVGKEFSGFFEELGAKLSVSESGFKGNIVIERFWRTYKYECVYLWDKMDLRELKEKTKEWVRYYNSERLHQALEYKTPDEVFYGQKGIVLA